MAKQLVITYGADAKPVKDALTGIVADHDGLAAKSGEVAGKVGGHFKNMALSTLGMGAGVEGVAAGLEHLGGPIEKARASLETALKDAGGSYEELKPKIDHAVDSQAKFGHGSADVQEALTKLTVGFGDGKKAVDELSVAQELSAYKHISLADAANALVKAHAGSNKELKALGINLKEAQAPSKELEAATKDVEKADTASAIASQKLADLHTVLAGKKKLTASESIALRNATEADAAAATKSDEAHTRLTKAQEAAAAGGAELTVEQQILAKTHGMAEAQAHTFGGEIEGLKTHVMNYIGEAGAKFAPVVAAAGPAMMLVTTVMEAGLIPALGGAIASTWAFTAALLANPFTWIVLGIIGLALAIYEIVKHWDTVKKWIGEFWGWIKEFVGKWGTEILLVLAPFIGIPLEIIKHWGAIAGFFSGVWNDIQNVFKGGANWVIDHVNDLIKGLNSIHIPGTDIGIHIPLIPRLAAGGAALADMAYIVGEKGPELFLPNQSGTVLPHGGTLSMAGGASAGTIINVTVNVGGSVVAERGITEAVYQGLLEIKRREGVLGLA